MNAIAVTPNPSLERTSTGWPLRVVVHDALRGQPAPAAQLKRLAAESSPLLIELARTLPCHA